MAKMNARELAAVVLTAATSMGMAPSAIAASTWNLAGPCSNCAGAVMSGMAAYSTTGAGSTFATAAAVSYGGDYGVTAALENTATPQHAMDNFGSTDAILLNFSNSVILKQLTVGWAAYDSDISVLRYTGVGAPVLAGKTIAQALSSGWVSVGNYETVAGESQTDGGGNNSTVTAINAGNGSSSWWLISAYSSGYGGTNTGSVGDGSGLYNSGSYDYVKLFQVGGDKAPGSVPEPGSLALVAAALLGGFAIRRRAPGLVASGPLRGVAPA